MKLINVSQNPRIMLNLNFVISREIIVEIRERFDITN